MSCSCRRGRRSQSRNASPTGVLLEVFRSIEKKKKRNEKNKYLCRQRETGHQPCRWRTGPTRSSGANPVPAADDDHVVQVGTRHFDVSAAYCVIIRSVSFIASNASPFSHILERPIGGCYRTAWGLQSLGAAVAFPHFSPTFSNKVLTFGVIWEVVCLNNRSQREQKSKILLVVVLVLKMAWPHQLKTSRLLPCPWYPTQNNQI